MLESIRMRFKPGIFFTLLATFLWCSCATKDSVSYRLPTEVTMNKDAGRGDWLIVMLRLQNGDELPFVLDTGMPVTVFSKSLESKLGKRQGTTTMWNFGAAHEAGIYNTPKLYLGNTQLRTGPKVIAYDYDPPNASPQGHASKGIIGMDILGHYCIQLDFQNGKVRFLDGEHENKAAWGRAFPLTDIGDGCFYIADNLTGTGAPGSLIDTGANNDGWLVPKLFQQWTNRLAPPLIGEVRSPNGVLGQEPYRELDLSGLAEGINPDDFHTKLNGIGLSVLSRNLVTLDFPKRMMYLKRTSDWRLAPLDFEVLARSTASLAVEHLKALKEKGQLPGWSQNDDGGGIAFHFPNQHLNIVTLDSQKKDNPSIYHHTLVRESKDSPWKIQRAWRTDQIGREIEQFPIP